MTPSISPYSKGLVSAKSRRLRTIGLLLLVAVIGMALYGFLGLMPTVKQSVRAERERIAAHQIHPSTVLTPAQQAEEARLHKAVKVQVLSAWSYWGVCGLLIIAALVVTWMDIREITRNYLYQRQTIHIESMASRARDRQE